MSPVFNRLSKEQQRIIPVFNRLSKEQQQKLIDTLKTKARLYKLLYEEYTYTAICRQFHMSPSSLYTIEKILEARGELIKQRTNTKEIPVETLATIKALTKRKVSTRAIADITGMGKTKINRLQHMHGWKNE